MFAYKKYSVNQFRLWRVLFGLYFLVYSLSLIPYVRNLYSSAGFVKDSSSNWTYGIFPSLFLIGDSPKLVFIATAILVAASTLFLVGYHRKISAIVMAFILISFFNRNNLTGDPAMSFVYWLLVATILIPDEKERKWEMPRKVYLGALFVLSVGYFMGGLLKLMSPSWANGNAMRAIFSLPNARFDFVNSLSNIIPMQIIACITLAVVLLELLAPLFLLMKRTRLYWLGALTVMHLLVLLFFTITQVSIGMLLYHLFLLDLAWIKKKD